MNHYKSNNYVPALAEQKFNYFSTENIVNSLAGVKKDIIGSYSKIKNDFRIAYYNHLLKEEIKGTFENLKKQPFKTAFIASGVISGAAAIVAYSPEIEKGINSFFQNFSIGSQAYASELKQDSYYLWEAQLGAIKYANENLWNMDQEFEGDAKFEEFKKEFNEFINYSNINHKLFMDLDKLKAIKLISPTGKNGSYNVLLHVKDLKPENTLKTELFNIPQGVNLEQYINSILEKVYSFNNKYESLVEKREAELPKETVEDKARETQQKIISEAQEAKQRTIEDYVSENLKSARKKVVIIDLDKFDKKINVYDAENATEMLKALDIPKDAIISYNKFGGIIGYNIILDYENLDDGKNQITVDKDGFTFLFDVPDAKQGYKVISKIQESRLEDLIVTDDVGAVVSDILANKSRIHYIIRNLKEEKPSFGIFSVPIDMKVKVGEILAKYIEGVKEGYDGAKFIFPEINKVEKETTPDEIEPIPPPIPPPITPPIPEPSPEQELNNNNDSNDPVNTGSDPNTGEGSTPENPVVNPDPDPHIF